VTDFKNILLQKLRTIMRLLLPIFAFSLLLFTACTSDENEGEADHPTIIFGVYHGFCQGDCAHLFKYENGEVFRDDINSFYQEEIGFSNESESALESRAKKVLDAFPESLKENTQETYGCPDCADQGGYFISLDIDGSSREWRLDTRPQEDWDDTLKDFTEILERELDEMIIR